MPELPEVETTLKGISPHLKNKIVTQVNIYKEKLRWPIEKNLNKKLLNKKLKKIHRRGKYLILEFENGSLLLHLGMSGSLRISTAKMPLKKHDHFEIIFNNKKILRLHDPRRFGAVLWTEENWQDHKLLKTLGPEPLTSEFNIDYLYKKSRNKTIAIKSFIMDSHIIVGVGNIYASEALFQSGIHPTRKTQNISKKRFETLISAIKEILNKAIKEGGTTLKDFTNADGKPGYFAQQLNVYGRSGQPCLKCASKIKNKIISQRATYYCPSCQR